MHVHDRTTTMGNHPSQILYPGTCHVNVQIPISTHTGHLEEKRLYGYLAKTKHFAIRYRTKEPDYSHLPKQEYEWTRTVYGNVKEELPKDIPKPLGKRVILAHF